jgi:hypothetical protein
MFLVAAIVNRDMTTISENLKFLNHLKSKRFFSLLIFVFLAYFCQNKSIQVTKTPTGSSYTLEVQPTVSEMSDIKTLVFNSGVAFNLPQETMSKIHQNIKTPHLKHPKVIDSSSSAATPKFRTYVSKSATVDLSFVTKMKSIQKPELLAMVNDILDNSLE